MTTNVNNNASKFLSEDYFIQWASSRPPIWMKFVSKSIHFKKLYLQ